MIKLILDYWYIWLPFVIIGLAILIGWVMSRGVSMCDIIDTTSPSEDTTTPLTDWINNPANPANPMSPLNPANPASPLNTTNINH